MLMLVLLRPMKLIQPKFNVVVAVVTNGLTRTSIHARLHNIMLNASQMQTIGTGSTVVYACCVCVDINDDRHWLTSRRQL
jgi:hypothetical protein